METANIKLKVEENYLNALNKSYNAFERANFSFLSYEFSRLL